MNPYEDGPLTRNAWWIAFVAILIAVLPPSTGWTGPAPYSSFGLIPRDTDAVLDALQNIALYVPFGLALAARGLGVGRASAAAAMLSVTTELAQVFIPGRDPSTSDIAMNVVGGWLGAFLFSGRWTRTVRRGFVAADRRVRRLIDPTQRHAGVISFGWAAVVALTLIFSVRLLIPAPLPPPYRVASADIDSSPGPVRIGGNGARDGYFSGLIDEVRIFSEGRSDKAVREDMRTPVANSARPATLVAAFGFDAAPGPGIRDDSERGHDATTVGARWTSAGRYGGAMSFLGAGEILVPQTVMTALGREWTVEAWIYPLNHPAPEATVIAASARSFFLYASTEQGEFEPAGGGVFGGELEQVRPRTRLQPGKWTHVALSDDGETLRFYMDGAVAATHRRWVSHRMLDARLNGVELRPGLLKNAGPVFDALRDDVRFSGTIECGDASPELAPLFYFEGLWDIDVFTLNVAGDDLLISTATWSRRVRLRSPPYRAPAALRGCSPGRRLHLDIAGPLQNPRVKVAGRTVDGSSPGIASGWTFLLHSELFPARVALLLNLAWLVLLVLPFGYFARSGWTVGGIMLIAATASLAPPIWQLPSASLAQSLALTAGTLAGAFLRFRASRQDSSAREVT